jgi:release factor glutamine methyltransferase
MPPERRGVHSQNTLVRDMPALSKMRIAGKLTTKDDDSLRRAKDSDRRAPSSGSGGGRTGADPWTILKLLKWAHGHFKTHAVDQPRTDAEILLSHALGLARVDLYLQYDRPLEKKELAIFKELVKRRLQREPVAYIVGAKGFWTLDLEVTPDVLIPRPETELVVEAALEVIPAAEAEIPFAVLDLGTGSGAVVLALARERNGHRFFGVDSSFGAVRLARRNAEHYGLHTSVGFFQGHWFDALKSRKRCFDVIVSNPPYVRSADLKSLPPEIVQYEPIQALDGGPDGLEAIRVIVASAPSFLMAGGWLIMEIGHDQGDSVQQLLSSFSAYEAVSVTRDYSGLDRVVRARVK